MAISSSFYPKRGLRTWCLVIDYAARGVGARRRHLQVATRAPRACIACARARRRLSSRCRAHRSWATLPARRLPPLHANTGKRLWKALHRRLQPRAHRAVPFPHRRCDQRDSRLTDGAARSMPSLGSGSGRAEGRACVPGRSDLAASRRVQARGGSRRDDQPILVGARKSAASLSFARSSRASRST